jgi:hypothetical protein
MSKTPLALFVALIFSAVGFTQVHFIEKDNYGVMSGLLTILVSLPFLISWVVMGIVVALLIAMPQSKGARIAASILLFIPTAATGFASVLLFSDGNDEEKMYPILPIYALFLTYAICISAWVKKRTTV